MIITYCWKRVYVYVVEWTNLIFLRTSEIYRPRPVEYADTLDTHLVQPVTPKKSPTNRDMNGTFLPVFCSSQIDTISVSKLNIFGEVDQSMWPFFCFFANILCPETPCKKTSGRNWRFSLSPFVFFRIHWYSKAFVWSRLTHSPYIISLQLVSVWSKSTPTIGQTGFENRNDIAQNNMILYLC